VLLKGDTIGASGSSSPWNADMVETRSRKYSDFLRLVPKSNWNVSVPIRMPFFFEEDNFVGPKTNSERAAVRAAFVPSGSAVRLTNP
jgi:hypothetical protein